MPDRKYTYQIEIDATQAKQQAAQLRALFERELGEIMAGGKGSTAAGPAAPVQAMRKEIEQISKIDLTAPIDDLQAALRTTQREINALAKEYDRLTLSGTRDSKTPAEAARYRSYVEEVRTRAGDDAAAAIASTGQYLNIGQRGAEEATDNEAAYLEFARDYHNQQRDVTDKQQRTIAEKMEVARVEAQLYEAQLQEAQTEKEIARRRMAAAESALGTADDADIMAILNAGQEAQEEMQRAADNERFLLQQIAEANDKVADLAKQEAAQLAEAERAAARRTGDIAGAVTGGTTTTRVQMTVTDASAAQAERLAAAYQEAAQSSGQIAENTERISKAKIEEARGVRESARIAEAERAAGEVAIRDAERRAAVAAENAKSLTLQKAAQLEVSKTARLAAQQRASAEAATTATAKAEANQRIAIARYESNAKIEAEKRATLAAKAEYNRQTQEFKREAAERTAAARASSGGKATGNGTIFGMTPGMMAGSALAAVGVYSVDQVARATYESGRSGAMLERQAQTFRQVAQRVGVAADAMIASIKKASKETITDADAMGLGAQVLAQKWASSSADIVGDTGRLVEASRRLAQIYTDENGQMLTTTEVFARLIKYVREGNKELVDQFGISNARIAESLGITTKGLAAAGGASDRFRGLIKVLGEDMERLGPAMMTTADQFEQSEARITAAKQRIDKALAGPVAGAAEFGADFLEGGQFALGGRDPALARSVMETDLEYATGAQRQQMIELLDLFDQTDQLTGKAAESAGYYKMQLADLANQIRYNTTSEAERAATMAGIQRSIDLLTSGQDAYTRAMAITTDEAIKQDARFLALVTTMGTYQRMYEDGSISLEQYNRASGALAVTLFNLASAAGVLAPALAGVNAQLGAAAAEPGGSLQARLAQSAAWRDFASNGYRPAGLAGPLPQDFGYGTPWAATQAGRDAGLSWFGERAQDWANVDPYQREVELNQMRADADRKAADAAAREWESAAKSAQSEWERAAKAAADAFKGALEAVPGLFSTTSVTEEDMTLAKYGMYEEKADEYLRQLRDEVINKKDYAGVDIRDAASRLGIDPNLAPEAILAKFEQAWANSSLFAGGANLDLINADAVKAGLAQQEASKSGKEAILKFFGWEAADVEAAGAEVRGQFLGGFTGEGSAAPAAEGEQADFLTPILDGMDAGLKAGDAADRIYGIGGAIVGRLYAGFTDAANNLAWGKPILDSLAASVAPQVYDMLAEELTP